MKNIDISIIIPCYDHGIYIREAIESVKAYKADNYEIIIVNDGSTDSYTLKVFSELENEGNFILHQENKGLGAARNNGIKISKGKYILLLDSDNKIKPEYIIKGISLLDQNKNLAVIYGKPLYFGTHKRSWPVQDFSLEKLTIFNFIDACSVLKKEAWEQVGGFDEHMVNGYEDWDLWLRIAVKGWKFRFIDEYLYEYRVREDSMVENTIKSGNKVIDYIFEKEELRFAKSYRELFLKNQQMENSIRLLSKFLIKNIKMRIKSYFH